MSEEQNARALRLRQLHKPGEPLVLCNVYDGATARIVLRHGAAKALATSSYATAAVRGKSEEALSPEILASAVRDIVGVVNETAPSPQDALPLSVDMRDGWGEKLEETVSALVEAGAVGCNLEDEDAETGQLMDVPTAAARVKRVMREAARVGVPDFVVNARVDVLGHGGGIDDAILRGRAYLDAGAACVFVWGGAGGRGVSRDEIEKLVGSFDGRLNARLKTGPGYLTTAELRELGVARISLGKELQEIAMAAYEHAVVQLLG